MWNRVVLALLAGLGLGAAGACLAELVSEEYMVATGDPGTELYVRNRRLAAMTEFPAERILLFVHGATYPSETSFDLRLGGQSWMDYIARQGYDVYMMDLRGYGRSTRPAEMSGAPEENPPIVTTDVAVEDFSTVAAHVRERRGVERINIMGWSWGTVTTAAYAARNRHRVARLVLFAPIWLRDGPSPIAAGGNPGAYRTVARDAARARWLAGVPEAERDAFLPAGWFEAWWEANMQADPVGAAESPPVVRAPNGVLEDSGRYWSAGMPYYDPADIEVPVLLALGEWDVDTPPYMSRALFGELVNAPVKRFVMIGGGTHTLLLEPNRMQLFREVQLFLDEGLAD